MNKIEHEIVKSQLERIKLLLESGKLSEQERSKLSITQSRLMGQLLSSWLPYGALRRLLMFVFILVGIIGIYEFDLRAISLLIGLQFSPRITGEIVLFIAKSQNFFNKK